LKKGEKEEKSPFLRGMPKVGGSNGWAESSFFAGSAQSFLTRTQVKKVKKIEKSQNYVCKINLWESS
jgi:hypothetical protein